MIVKIDTHPELWEELPDAPFYVEELDAEYRSAFLNGSRFSIASCLETAEKMHKQVVKDSTSCDDVGSTSSTDIPNGSIPPLIPLPSRFM